MTTKTKKKDYYEYLRHTKRYITHCYLKSILDKIFKRVIKIKGMDTWQSQGKAFNLYYVLQINYNLR